MAHEEIILASPPDRESLVAEIFIDRVQLAEVNTERGEPDVEFFPRPDGKPWRLPYAQVVSLLERARRRLTEPGGQHS